MDSVDRHENARMHYDEKLGHLEAEVKAIHKRLDDLVASIKPKPHVYAIMFAVVTSLIAIGTFALKPITDRQASISADLKEAMNHNDDGHPQSVLQLINSMDRRHTNIMNRLVVMQERDEERIDSLSVRTAVIETKEEQHRIRLTEVMEQRDKLNELRSSDRWTGQQQNVYGSAIEQRLKKLEGFLPKRQRSK